MLGNSRGQIVAKRGFLALTDALALNLQQQFIFSFTMCTYINTNVLHEYSSEEEARRRSLRCSSADFAGELSIADYIKPKETLIRAEEA